jgi:hypothetical protein
MMYIRTLSLAISGEKVLFDCGSISIDIAESEVSGFFSSFRYYR